MKKLLLIPIIVLFAFYSWAGECNNVVRVVDGDTVVINYHGKEEKIRLLCIDTPESVHPDKSRNTEMGKKASSYARERLTGRCVDLEFEGRKRGRFGRLLAYLIIDGVNFNIELVSLGYSPYYTKYGKSKKYNDEFIDAEEHAKYFELNIWGNDE